MGSEKKPNHKGAATSRLDLSSMSRRDFGGLLIGAGLSLAGVGNTKAWASSAPAATPKTGGTVRIALNSQGMTDTFDGARSFNPGDWIRCASVFSYLTRMSPDGRALPEVARAFESSADAKVWTFSIVKGIVFSDGSPLTMDDLIFSIMRHKEKNVVSGVKEVVANIKAVKADGPNTLVVELFEPDADIPVTLSAVQFTIVKNGTYDFSKPIGTGPFVVKEFSPGVRTICVRNKNYWKPKRPYIDQFEMFPIVDQVARANALLSGDVDMAVDIRGPSIAKLRASGVANPVVTKAPRFTAIQAGVQLAPADSHDLRLAFAHLMNRERVLQTVLLGNGEIGNDFPINKSSPYYNSQLAQRHYDPDQAKFHIAKSGIGKGKVPVHVSDASAFSVEIGQLLQREAANIGLNIDLRREPADSYWSAIAGKRPFFAITVNPRPTYNIALNTLWKSDAPKNFSNYKNPKLDSLIDLARATLDDQKREQIYHEINAIIHDSAALVLPAFIDYVDGISNRVQGFEPLPISPLGGCFFTDQIWLDA